MYNTGGDAASSEEGAGPGAAAEGAGVSAGAREERRRETGGLQSGLVKYSDLRNAL